MIPSLPACFSEPDARPESARFADEITQRPDELVFITRNEDGSAALRQWGLLAFARPPGGQWTVESLRPLTGRDVSIVNADPLGETSWINRDRITIRDTTRRIGSFVPVAIEVGKAAGLAELVTLHTRSGIGSQSLVSEALGHLAETMPRVDPPGIAGDWPPLRLGKLPDVGSFPVDVLPDPMARLVCEASGAVGCDPGMAGGPALAIAGGLIGRSASLRKGPNWFASACVFQANVALPGDGKSPCLGYVMTPVGAIDQELDDEFQGEKRRYLDECKADRKNKPNPPIPRRVVLEDTTLEACFRILSSNARGLLMCNDELATLILGLNQYKGGSGNDAPNLMKIWAGASVVIDRVLNDLGEPIRIAHPSLSITGNLPPANLPDLVNRRGDVGFLDRWLYVYPERRPKLKSGQRRPVSDEAISGWTRVCRNLWGRPLALIDGRPCPHVVGFSEKGKTEFDRLYDAHVDEVNAADFPDALRGPWSKLEEYAGRLCLILALLRHAADPTADPQSLPVVGPDLAREAWRLVGYFKGHHRRVRAALEGKGLAGAPEGARLILNWIRNHPEEDTVPESELTRTYRRFRDDRASMEDGLHWLEQRNALRRVSHNPPTGKTGRKPAPDWGIHPDLRRPEKPEKPENE